MRKENKMLQPKTVRKRRRRIIYFFLLNILVIFVFSGCTIGYFHHLIHNQFEIIHKRKPIQEVLESKSISFEHKRKLRLILEAKRFGEENFGLEKTENYTTYADINREFVSYVVSASSKYKLKPYQWKFPFLGTMLYKGYFDLEEALKEKEKLKKMDLDTYLRPVATYSTLGWFKDPVLSSMMKYDDSELINFAIHELVHATIYLKEYPEFNEGVATFIGNQGSLEFLKFKYGKDAQDYKMAKEMIHDDLLFSKFLKGVYKNLEEFYSLVISKEEKLKGRERIFRDSKEELRRLKGRFKTETYIKFYGKARLNNAFILALSQYLIDLENYYTVFEIFNHNLKRTVNFFKGEEFKRGDPMKYLKKWIKDNKSTS